MNRESGNAKNNTKKGFSVPVARFELRSSSGNVKEDMMEGNFFFPTRLGSGGLANDEFGISGGARKLPQAAYTSGKERSGVGRGKGDVAPLASPTKKRKKSNKRSPPPSRPPAATHNPATTGGRWAVQLPIAVGTSDPSGIVKRLLGPRGAHVKRIARDHRAKLRVRGIGSGHLEGRRQVEAQVQLHMCVSAASQADLNLAVEKARRLIARAVDSETGPSGKAQTLRVALVNEGKLSDAASFVLSGWAREKGVQCCLVSEGALPGRNLTTEPGFSWAAPLKQRKGGAGFLLEEEIGSAGGKVKLAQCTRHSWSLALWYSPGGTGLVSAYINPSDGLDPEARSSFLARLSALTRDLPRCVVGGDFNAATGTPQRRDISGWALQHGFSLANPGRLTHFAATDSRGTDLDLIFTRGVSVQLAEVEGVQRGHLRQIFEITEAGAPAPSAAHTPFAWRKLENAHSRENFVAGVNVAMGSHSNLDVAIQAAAATTLGTARGPSQRSRPLPPEVRREVNGLRKRTKGLAKGSPEYQGICREIGAVMRRHRDAAWKTTLVKLASAPVVENETWRLHKHLLKAVPTAKTVGIPDREVRETFETIYTSNRTRRLDWCHPAKAAAAGTHPELDAAFTTDEVVAALKTLANGKAAGLDGIPHEAYKALSEDPLVAARIAAEATQQLMGGAVPPLQGKLVVIPKKGAPERASDMRPLMMLPTSRKLVEKLVVGRLDRLAEMRGSDGFHPLQGAFRHGLCIDRQLVFAQAVIADAKATGRPLRMVGLDLVKAFDRIPKEFAAHCAVGYLGTFCPGLADLVARLTLTSFEARIGDQKFAATNGVPQGGILSPWLFAMAMNDLALRVAGDGGYSIGGFELGTLLFADDTLLADADVESSNSRCRLAKDWAEEWGGEIHPAKTQWLDINVNCNAGPGGLQGSGSCIDYLGVLLTPDGVKAKVGPEVFAETLRALRCTMELRGLQPAPALQVLRSVAWAKVAHGAVVTLPCTATLTTKWLATARQILGTFTQVHRAEVQRELGLLYHPVAWVCKAVVKFYGTALTTERDPVLRTVLREIVGSPHHPLRLKIEAALRPTGISWPELVAVPTVDLLRKADARLRNWSREQLLGEAVRLGLSQGEGAPLWREWGDGPRKYLYEENSRYGFMFRRGSFAPADLHTPDCYFCGHSAGDWGRHLLRCHAARIAVPLPAELASLDPQSLEQALLLEDATPAKRLRVTLDYMKQLYQVRSDLRAKRPQPSSKRYYAQNPNLFKFEPRAALTEFAPTTNGSRRRRRSATGAGEGPNARMRPKRRRLGPPPSPPSPSSGEEQRENDSTDMLVLLDEPCHECPHSPSSFPSLLELTPDLSRKTGRAGEVTDSPAAKKQARDSSSHPLVPENALERVAPAATPQRMAVFPTTSRPRPPPATLRDGPWSAQETEQLAAAAMVLGCSSGARLALHVPSRSARQIKVKMTTAEFRRVLSRLSQERRIPAEHEGPSQSPASAPSERLSEDGSLGAAPPTQGTADLGTTTSPPVSPQSYRDGRWSAEEHARLLDAVRRLGPDASREALSEAVGTRSRSQVFERLRLRSTEREIHALTTSSVAPSHCVSGRWDEEELNRLEDAINQLGGSLRHAELATILGGRTISQVAAKVRDLLLAGLLQRTGPSSFTILRM